MNPPRNLVTVKGKAFTVSFHAGQMQAMQSNARVILMLSGSQGGKCMAVDSMVQMADGTRRAICDVKAGDVILSLDSTLQIAPRDVTASFSTGVQPLFRIVVSNGRSVKVTAEHPLLTPAGWLPCGELTEGDWVAVPRHIPDNGVGQDTQERMRLLGYLLGDGGLTNCSPIFTSADEEILRDVAQILPEPCYLKYSSQYDYRISAGTRTKMGGNPVIEWCREWGILGSLSKHKRMPAFVWGLHSSSIAPIIQALFACDATVDVKGIEIVLASQGMIDDLQDLLLRFGIVARKKYKASRCGGKTFPAWRLSFRDMGSLKSYQEHIGFVGFKNERLAALIERKEILRENGKDAIPGFPIKACYEALGKREWRKSYADNDGYLLLRGARYENVARCFAQKIADHFGIGHDLAYANIAWTQIKSIEALGPCPVWDLTVNEGHNFIADGFYAHNTACLPWWLVNEIKTRGPGDYLAVTSSYPLYQNKFLPEMVRVFDELLGLGDFVASRQTIEFRRPGTRILLGSAASPSRLEAATAKAAVCDELGQPEFGIDAWYAIRRRVALNQGRIFGATTPYTLGWLKTEVYDRWRRKEPGYDVIQFESTMNPAFPREEFERLRRELPAWRFNMFYRGLFDVPEMLIYRDWVEHADEWAIEPFPIPKEWPRYVGWDFGGVNLASLWCALDPETDLLYFYREALMGNGSVSEYARQAHDFADGEELSLGGMYQVGGAGSEEQWRRDFRAHGVPIRKPLVDGVEAGLDRGVGLIRKGRVRVFRTLVRLLDDFGSYSREMDTAGNPTEAILNKADFHFADAYRYLATVLGRAQSFRGMVSLAMPVEEAVQ